MYLKYLIFFIFFIIITPFCSANETINAKNNAYEHNNKGLLYLQDNYYFGAIKEFQIAIDLNPKSQASAAYYTNLGNTYEKIGYNNLATPCYEKALSLNPLYFNNYLTLAQNYKKIGSAEKKLAEFESKTTSPLNEVMVGLLYIQTGQISTGITVLDDFTNKEENLILSIGIREYLKKITEDN